MSLEHVESDNLNTIEGSINNPLAIIHDGEIPLPDNKCKVLASGFGKTLQQCYEEAISDKSILPGIMLWDLLEDIKILFKEEHFYSFLRLMEGRSKELMVGMDSFAQEVYKENEETRKANQAIIDKSPGIPGFIGRKLASVITIYLRENPNDKENNETFINDLVYIIKPNYLEDFNKLLEEAERMSKESLISYLLKQ